MPIQLCAFFIPMPQSNFWQSSRSDQHRLCYYVGTYVAIWDMILQLGSLVPNFSYCSVDALVMYLQTSSTHMVVNFHYSCRLQWLASMSELLEKWVSVTLPSPGNAPMIGSNILGYIRIPHRRGSFVISSSPISHTMFHMFQKPNCFLFLWPYSAVSSNQHMSLKTSWFLQAINWKFGWMEFFIWIEKLKRLSRDLKIT